MDKIILFGSGARWNCRENSDWDILIVTNENLDRTKFWIFFKDVKRELSNQKIYGDLIIVFKGLL